ncbi:hypothetical protein EDB84DRAFT_1124766 [Lactarius hengduanensis]|nr:hypothetical protein EDB84DRAFT_1124766 [Lactarius hengduanensis]
MTPACRMRSTLPSGPKARQSPTPSGSPTGGRVDGFGELNVHDVHQKSTAKGAIPLLFVHGWPGSFLEVTKPSRVRMVGSGAREGLQYEALCYAELFNKLMISLGYTEYVTKGRDWGHILTLTTASLYGPKHVKVSHKHAHMRSRPRSELP